MGLRKPTHSTCGECSSHLDGFAQRSAARRDRTCPVPSRSRGPTLWPPRIALPCTFSFLDLTALGHFSPQLFRGDRIGLLGPHCCGHHTYLPSFTQFGALPPPSGTCRLRFICTLSFRPTMRYFDCAISLAAVITLVVRGLPIGGLHFWLFRTDFSLPRGFLCAYVYGGRRPFLVVCLHTTSDVLVFAEASMHLLGHFRPFSGVTSTPPRPVLLVQSRWFS